MANIEKINVYSTEYDIVDATIAHPVYSQYRVDSYWKTDIDVSTITTNVFLLGTFDIYIVNGTPGSTVYIKGYYNVNTHSFYADACTVLDPTELITEAMWIVGSDNLIYLKIVPNSVNNSSCQLGIIRDFRSYTKSYSNRIASVSSTAPTISNSQICTIVSDSDTKVTQTPIAGGTVSLLGAASTVTTTDGVYVANFIKADVGDRGLHIDTSASTFDGDGGIRLRDSSTNKDVVNAYLLRAGTPDQYGMTYINVGNSTPVGTAGNVRGAIGIYAPNEHKVNLATAVTITATRQADFPDISGTVILDAGAQTLTGAKTFSGGLISSSTTTLSNILIGKAGSITDGNYMSTPPSGTGKTGQIMFYIPS